MKPVVDGLRSAYSGYADVVALNPAGSDRVAVRNLMIKYGVMGYTYPIFVFTNSSGAKKGSVLHSLVYSRSTLAARLDGLLPKVQLSRPTLSVSSPSMNVAVYIRGTCSPRRPSSMAVRLQVQRKVGSTYKAWRTLNVTLAAKSTAYSLRYKMPIRGAFRIRAYHSDASHGASSSSYRNFTVK